MAHVSYTELRNNLSNLMDTVCDSRAPLLVTRQNARSVVMLSEDEYEGVIETVHLLRSPANTNRLFRPSSLPIVRHLTGSNLLMPKLLLLHEDRLDARPEKIICIGAKPIRKYWPPSTR